VRRTFKRNGNCVTVSSLGGMVTNYSVDGEEIIYPEETINGRSRGGAPICFPVVGVPPKIFPGMRKHGFLRNQELEVVSEHDDGIIFFGRNEVTKEFPWQLEYHVATYLYGDSGLTMKLVATRKLDGVGGKMPFNAAFHSYFSTRGRHGVITDGQIISRFPDVSMKIPMKDDLRIDQGRDFLVGFIHNGFDANSCFSLWSDNEWKYFCVESLLGYPALFGTRSGRFLREGEKATITCTILAKM
jgi:galactose mutarotase-like enzyme